VFSRTDQGYPTLSSTARTASCGDRGPRVRPVALALAILVHMGISPDVGALPIGFGTNQGELEYSSLRGENFIIYHDRRTPNEGRMTLQALAAVDPLFRDWFKVTRDRRLPVITSAVSENASFANFVTDSIELQTMGQGTRDLAWHEYVHTTMYRHFDNWFGPAGSLLHLIWMPVWFIEGLAEALSVSVPSYSQAGIERWQALNNTFPSWDRIHSLYGGGAASTRYYATSGAFVAWLLRTYDADRLPVALEDFYRSSMPWYWPWAAVPFNGWMPMDAMLERWTGKPGEVLYDEYRAAAKAYWSAVAAREDVVRIGSQAGARMFLRTTSSGLEVRGNRIFQMMGDGAGVSPTFHDTELTFNPKTGWATGTKRGRAIAPDAARLSRVIGPTYQAVVTDHTSARGRKSSGILVRSASGSREVLRRNTLIMSVHDSGAMTQDMPSGLWFFEQDTEHTRLCRLTPGESAETADVACPVAAVLPRSLSVLGYRTVPNQTPATTATKKRVGFRTAEVWLAEREETISGERFTIIVVDLAKGEVRRIPWQQGGAPLAVAFTGRTQANVKRWVLVGEKSFTTIRETNPDGSCALASRLSDHPVSLHGFANGDLAVGIYAGGNVSLRRVAQHELQFVPCWHADSHTSPILAAMRVTETNTNPPASVSRPSLKSAVAAANLWVNPETLSPSPERDATSRATEPQPSTPALDQQTKTAGVVTAKREETAPWRGRSVLAFPWIGAEDALGSQLGIVSVPLMDHMQNETVRATFLVGLASRYPNTDISLVSTRFWPTLTLSGFRQQTWNGQFVDSATREIVSSFLDEKGARFSADLPIYVGDGVIALDAGLKYSHLRPFIGPHRGISRGFLAEPFAGMSHTARWGKLSWSNGVNTRVAPGSLNTEFDYNQVAASSTLRYRFDFLSLGLEGGIEGSRTRWRDNKRRNLLEVYRPLKTFVPGSGGGYNQNSFALAGDGSLFTARFGSNQGRVRTAWNLPIITDMEKFLWIFYFSRLDLTGFYNYGGAWRGSEAPKSEQLIAAQGYNLDLQFDNKGVNLNAGVGVGQVFEETWQAYASFGFDALF